MLVRCLMLCLLAATAVGCARGYSRYPAALHVVDGEVVHSPPPPAAAYAAYLRARVALSADPPQLELAQRELEQAIRIDPRDPHLWTTQAEVAELRGDVDTARAAAERALALRPGYQPAQRMLAKIDGGPAAAQTPAR